VPTPAKSLSPSLLPTRQRGADDALKLVKPRPAGKINWSDAYRQNFSGKAPADQTKDLPAGSPAPAPRPKPSPVVTVTQAPRPTLPENYAGYRQRMKDEFHARQRRENAALVNKYRQGDAAFAATATPAQKKQADVGFAALMKKRRAS
jgi:hypothetical protein